MNNMTFDGVITGDPYSKVDISYLDGQISLTFSDSMLYKADSSSVNCNFIQHAANKKVLDSSFNRGIL